MSSVMRDLAPDIVRQRLLIEGLFERDVTRQYFGARELEHRSF